MKLRACTAISLVLLPLAVTAQVGPWFSDMKGAQSGQTVVPFLKMTTSASVLGQGQASSMGAMDATDAVTFPANTALFEGNRFSITHLEWMMGLRTEYAGASFPVSDAGVISVFSKVFTPGRWEGRDIDENAARPAALDYSIGAAFAKKLLDNRLSAGLAVAYLESHLDEATARGVYANIDIRGMPLDLVEARLRVENLGPKVTYVQTPEPLPLTAAAAVTVKPITRLVDITDRFDFNVGLGALKAADDPLTVGGHLECRVISRIFTRVGYEYALGRRFDGTEGLSAGLGVRIDKYGFDFGWKDQSSSLGMVWSASAHFQGADVVPRTAKDYYTAAERNFLKGRYTRCIFYAKKALAMDPNMWQASTLIARANAEMRRQKGLEVALIYTGNYKGQFVPVATPDGVLGGLARQATAVRQLRAAFPASVSLDVCNTVDAGTHPLKAQIAASYYRQLGYDAVAPGTGEQAFGMEAFTAAVKDSNAVPVCSNCILADAALVSKQVVHRGRFSIAVLSVIGAQKKDDAGLRNALEALSHLLNAPDAMNANLRVLVVHDSWENLRAAAQTLPAIEIIVCGEQDQPFESPMKAGTVSVLSAGSRGLYVGSCVVRFDDRGKVLSLENRLIPLTGSVLPDPQVADVIRRMTMRMGLDSARVDEQELAKGSVDGVFPFTSNRDGGTGLYLKVIDRNAEFPLTDAAQECYSPVTSPKSGRIAYLRTTAKGRELVSMNMAGLDKRAISAGRPSSPAFTPDGQWLYYSAAAGGSDTTAGIWRVAVNGATSKVVLDWPGSSERDVSFSRDSQFMAFTSDRDSGKAHVYLTNPLAENPIRVSEYRADHARPLFSPDGAYLAYFSTYTGYRGKYDVWVYDRKNTGRRRITQDGHVAQYCWLGDSKRIVYSSGVNLVDLNIVDPGTGDTRKLIATDSVKNYSETSPQAVTFKGVERVMYVRDYPSGKRRVFWVKTDGTDDVPVVTGNKDSWLEGK